MILNKKEIIDITGFKNRNAQARELSNLGILYKLRSDGSPLVLKDHVSEVLGGSSAKTMVRDTSLEPDWAELEVSCQE